MHLKVYNGNMNKLQSGLNSDSTGGPARISFWAKRAAACRPDGRSTSHRVTSAGLTPSGLTPGVTMFRQKWV